MRRAADGAFAIGWLSIPHMTSCVSIDPTHRRRSRIGAAEIPFNQDNRRILSASSRPAAAMARARTRRDEHSCRRAGRTSPPCRRFQSVSEIFWFSPHRARSNMSFFSCSCDRAPTTGDFLSERGIALTRVGSMRKMELTHDPSKLTLPYSATRNRDGFFPRVDIVDPHYIPCGERPIGD